MFDSNTNLIILFALLILSINSAENFMVKNKKVCTPKIFDKKILGKKIKINGVCFYVPEPDVKKIQKEIDNKVKAAIKDATKSIKKDVVDPAIKGVKKDVVDPAVKGIKNIIGKIEEKIGTLAEKVLDKIIQVLVVVIKIIFTVMLKPIVIITWKIAKSLWGIITTIAPSIRFVPYMMVASLIMPILFPLILIGLVLSIFMGPPAFLIIVGGSIAIPIGLYFMIVSELEKLKNKDWEKEIQDLIKKDAPEAIEKIFEVIKEKIVTAIKAVGKIKL